MGGVKRRTRGRILANGQFTAACWYLAKVALTVVRKESGKSWLNWKSITKLSGTRLVKLEPIRAIAPDPEFVFRYPTLKLVLNSMGSPAASCAGAVRATVRPAPSRNGAAGMNEKARESAVQSRRPLT